MVQQSVFEMNTVDISLAHHHWQFFPAVPGLLMLRQARAQYPKRILCLGATGVVPRQRG
jgi:hypothetical protein